MIAAERERRLVARVASQQDVAEESLYDFVKLLWHVVEPARPFVEGWAAQAICEHLQAVTDGEIKRLLINVPPGFTKSLLTDVFWPAWEWGPRNLPSYRYIAASYSQGLTIRDNIRFRRVIMSNAYRQLWGHLFGPSVDQFNITKVSNDHTGWKLATSVGGMGTGERADRFVIDDANNVMTSESEAVLATTNIWLREVVPDRLNSQENSAILNIQQRTSELDASGTLLSLDVGYVHLMIPMEFESGRKCVTVIGWEDPRTEEGELAWPERFPEAQVAELKTTKGPYAYAGQYQQAPTPRGGGIFKRDWWQLWEDTEQLRFKDIEWIYLVASTDTAYTEREENDPSACTVWGMFADPKTGAPRIMLVHAWRKHLQMHGPYIERLPGEKDHDYRKRASPEWGLVEWLADTCRRFKVDRLLIESKASGITAAQELQRLHGTEGWGVQLEPVHGDKVARAHAVQPVFSQGLVYAPDRVWAELVIEEMENFPKGRFKDLTDSATQAIRHLRDAGLIEHRHERAFADEEAGRHRKRSKPLYPA